jgi:hypothetical protein
MRQTMPFGARPTDCAEGIMPVQIGGSVRARREGLRYGPEPFGAHY